MNAPSPFKQSRAVLALASLGFALGAWLTPGTAIAQQRTGARSTPPATVTPRGSVTARKPGDQRAVYGGSTCEWDGSTGAWSNPAKWSCGHVPGTQDEAFVSAGTVALDTGMSVSRFVISGGTMEVASFVSAANPIEQVGGDINLRQDGILAFPQGHRFLQNGGTLMVEIGGLTRFGRMDFDNHIGGLGLFGLGGNLSIVGRNGYVPGDLDEFLFMNGSSMSATGGGYIPQVSHTDFPQDFRPVLGLFSGRIRNIYPGACTWIGGYSLFGNPSNWSCGRVPTASDTVILDAAQIEFTGSYTVARLITRNYPRLFGFGNTLTALGQPQVNELTGPMDLSQNLVLALGDSVASNAQFSLYGQSVIENQGRFSSNSGSLQFVSGAGGVVHNMPGGTIDLRLNALFLYGGDIELLNEGEIVLNTPQQGSIFTLEAQDGARLRQTQGRFVLNDVVGNYFDPPPTFQLEGGELVGNGRFDFPMNNSGGIIRPGMPTSCGGGGEALSAMRASVAAFTAPSGCSTPGYLEFLGYTQGPDGTLELQLGSGGDDDFSVTGPANLAGKLSLRDLNGIRPEFDLNLFFGFPVTGTFDTFDSDFGPDYALAYARNTVLLKYLGTPPVRIAPVFTSGPAPSTGKVGVPYAHTFTASGTPAPAFFAGSTLPPGLTLAANGELSGTPLRPDTYAFDVLADNGVEPFAVQSVTLVVALGDAAEIVTLAGSPQSAVVGSRFGTRLRAVVRDFGGNPVPGVGVNFTAPPSGASASLDPATTTSDASGEVSSAATAIGGTGGYSVTASAPGVPGAGIFNLTNVATAQAATFGITVPTVNYGEVFEFRVRAVDTTGEPLPSGRATVFVSGVEACSVELPDTRCEPRQPIEPGVRDVRAVLSAPLHTAPDFLSTIFIGAHAGSMILTAPAGATVGTPLDVTATLKYLFDFEEIIPGTLPPTGVIEIKRAGVTVCSAPVTARDSSITCQLPITTRTHFTLSAEYAGDVHYQAVSKSQTVIVANTGEGYDVGDLAPDFTVHDHLGNPRTLREFLGKNVLLDFCAAWCAPCQQMGYDAGAIRQTFAGNDFEYVTIVMQDPGQQVSTIADAREWLSEHPFFGPTMHLNGDANPNRDVNLFHFGVNPSPAFPTLVMLGPDQRIRAKQVGSLEAGEVRDLVADAIGIPRPVVATRLATSGLTQAGIEVRVNGTLVLDAGPIAPTSGSFLFSGNGLTVEITTEGVRLPPYDEHVGAFVTRAGGFSVGDVVAITLRNIAFADGYARLPGANGTLNGATLALAPETITAANTTGLETGTRLDLDFLNTGPAPGTPPAITSAAPPATGQVGVSYQHQYTATGTAPIAFSLASGALPDGLGLSGAGLLSGTPTSAGTFNGSVRAVGAAPPEATQGFSITIAPAAPVTVQVTVTKTGLGTGRVTSTPAGMDCGVTCTVSFISGAPVQLVATADAGSRFDGWSGSCSGTGSCAFTPSESTSVGALFSLLPPPPTKPVFTSAAPGLGNVGIAYGHTFTASGTSPITFSLGSGALPPGLALTNDGILSGTPTAPGTFNATIAATNTAGNATQAIAVTIVPAAQTHLEIAGGNHQVAFYNRARLTGDAFPAPLKVRVLGPSGDGIPGQRVEFLSLGAPNSVAARADLSAQAVVSDARGEASVIATAANGAGPHQVRASVTGLEPVIFDLTNVIRAIGTDIVLAPPSTRSSGAGHRTPLLAPFHDDIAVMLVSKLDARVPVPGREVRFYVPFDPNGTNASAVLEGTGSGRLTASESPRPDDGFYRLYATAISGTDSIARVKGFANNRAGAYDIIAVLVEDGDSLDPTLAPAEHRLALPMENLDTKLGVRLTPATQQQARAHEEYPQGIGATVFDSTIGPTAGISGAEVWIFAGDDARGQPGATIVAADGIEGRLPGGERYTALTTDLRGQARFTAIANRYKGKHFITIAYPGSYASLGEAKIQSSNPFMNTTGVEPDGGTGEGPAIASLEIVSGDFQRIASGSSASFAFPLVVRARDSTGRPIANALVRFVPIATLTSSTRETLRSTAILTDSSVMTDGNGLAQVGARPEGDGQTAFKVRASAEGAEPVYFTLRLTAPGVASGIELSGVSRSSTRGGSGLIGTPQSQVTLARFDEPLSVVAGSVAGRTRATGQAVRFYYPAAAFEPESGSPGVFVDAGGKPHPYVTLVTDGNGAASLRGIAGPNAMAFDVVALIPDASPANDNDPSIVAAKHDGRTFTFNLRNTAPGVTLTLEQGNFQGIETGQPFFRSLKVRAVPSNPDPAITHAAPGLDGADLWFMSPLVTDEKTPAAALLEGDVHTLVDSGGKAWRVVAVPIADDGIAETHPVANDVAGSHRIVVAYPGTFTDPAAAKPRVEFFLCNGQPRSAPCQDPAVTPGSIELVDAGPLFTLTSAAPPLRVRVKNQLGQVMAGTNVAFTTTSTGTGVSGAWQINGAVRSAGFTTGADGIADGGPGLAVLNANQEYVVTAGAGTQQATLRFVRYAPATTIAPAGPIVSSALINTRHRALQVTAPNPAPIEWTVLPGSAGASATFAGGSLAARDIQPPLRPGATTYTLPALTANGIAGTFTLKATIIGTTVTATFAMVNLASAPGSVAPADAGPNYAYGLGEPPIRALVRDTNGQPLGGVEVTFTASGAFSYPSSTPWLRSATSSARTRVVVTGADGIANASGGISLLNSFAPESIVAAVQGVTQTARIEVVRYNPPGTIRATSATSSAVLIGTQHAPMSVELAPAIPVRWTIVAAGNGAGGTFTDGSTSLVRFPFATGPGTQSSGATVRANAIAGTFILRVQQLDGTGVPPVDFTLTNLASAPASVAPADPAPRYAYGLGEPPVRAIVLDAAGQPLGGVPVTFTASGAFSYPSSTPWVRSATTSARTRVVVTGADGIANATGGISLLNAYAPETIVAAVQGVTQTARIELVRYNPPGTLRPVGATISAVVIGAPHASMTVEASPAIPVRWTIVAAGNGAGGTFSDGTTSLVRHPSPTGPGTQQSSVTVRANAIAGTFILRAQPLDGTGVAPVDFSLGNLATAPASVAPADPAPRYAYGLSTPPLRAIVRDGAGQPLAGVPVTFTATGAFSYPTSTPWIRTGTSSTTTRVVITGAEGIADASGGISLLNSYAPETILATVQGVTQAARIEIERINPPSRFVAFGATTSIAAVDTFHAPLSVEMAPQVPIRWTIVAAPNGAGGTFADGSTTRVVTAGAPGTGRPSAAVKANGIPGVFTLRAQPADFPAFAPVDFTLTNLTALPGLAELADRGKPFTYGERAPALRIRVKDAAGNALAAVPVVFTAAGRAVAGSGWTSAGGQNVRTFFTGADGIVDGSDGLRYDTPYVEMPFSAAVPGLAAPVTGSGARYAALRNLESENGLVKEGNNIAEHLLRVIADPPVPLRWTIESEESFIGGRFFGQFVFDDGQVAETYPRSEDGSREPQVMSVRVRVKPFFGTFTVRVEAIGVEGPALVFSVKVR